MINKIRHIALFLFSLLFAWSCTDTDGMKSIGNGDDLPLKITMSSDLLKAPQQETVTKNNLQIYYFKKDKSGQYLFAYESDPNDLQVTSKSNGVVEIETTVNFSRGSEVKFMILTDYNGAAPTVGQSLDDLNTVLTYSLSGVWNSTNSIPMSGEGEFTADSKIISTKVTMIRSLAAVDIILDTNDTSPYEFKALKSVRVYRTKNEVALAVPSNHIDAEGEVIKPTEVSGALYNLMSGGSTSNLSDAEKEPLLYNVSGNSTKLENQIFIPESYHATAASMGKVVTMVIGVQTTHEGKNKDYYYRIDFGEYDDDNSSSPLPFYSILRNHRYVISVIGANDPGYETPEEALTTKSSVWVKVESWNDMASDTEFNGQYNFKMDSSDVSLNEDEGDEVDVYFETNIPAGDLSNAITFSWGDEKAVDSQYFEAFVDEDKSAITVRTKTQNTTQTIFREVMTVHVFKQEFKVNVHQGEKLPDYVLSQRIFKVNGEYVVGKKLDPTKNTISLRLYAREADTQLNGLAYHLKAIPVGGIYIDYQGIFKNLQFDDELKLYYEDITVPVLGIATDAKNKILSIVTDGYRYSLLNVEIPFALTKKVVLDFYGEETTGKENLDKLINSGDYSLNVGARVFIEGVELIHTQSTDMAGEIQRYNPDVIIIRNKYPFTSDHFDSLSQFMFKRNKYRASNSVIVLSANSAMVDFMNKYDIMSSGTIHDINLVDYTGNRKLLYNPITPVVEDVNTKYRYKLSTYAENYVVHGPFGSLGERYIALSKDSKYIFKMSSSTIFKYTGGSPFAAQDITRDYGVSMFSSIVTNLFWVGSDGFIDSEQDKWMFNSQGKIIDYNAADYTFKSPSETYPMVLTSNGVLFANVLYWAFYNSEYRASKTN